MQRHLSLKGNGDPLKGHWKRRADRILSPSYLPTSWKRLRCRNAPIIQIQIHLFPALERAAVSFAICHLIQEEMTSTTPLQLSSSFSLSSLANNFLLIFKLIIGLSPLHSPLMHSHKLHPTLLTTYGLCRLPSQQHIEVNSHLQETIS